MKNQLFTIALVFLAMASFGQKYGTTPEDSLTCLENSSLYKEFYKQKTSQNPSFVHPKAWFSLPKHGFPCQNLLGAAAMLPG